MSKKQCPRPLSTTTVFTHVEVFTQAQDAPTFTWIFWSQVTFKIYTNPIPMYKMHPYFWCSVLGQKGASYTRVETVFGQYPREMDGERGMRFLFPNHCSRQGEIREDTNHPCTPPPMVITMRGSSLPYNPSGTSRDRFLRERPGQDPLR